MAGTAEPNTDNAGFADYLMENFDDVDACAAWYKYKADPKQSHQIPLMLGWNIPTEPTVVFNYFDTFSNAYGATAEMTNSVIAATKMTFLNWNATRLMEEGFSTDGAKFLSYLRLHLSLSGALTTSTDPNDGDNAFLGPWIGASAGMKGFDEVLYTQVSEAWPAIVAMAIMVFRESGHRFTKEAVDRCEKMWTTTKWWTLLRVGDVKWVHIIEYGLRVFSYRALIIAVMSRILSGRMKGAPIFQGEAYHTSEWGCYAFDPGWCPEAIACWWHTFRNSALKMVIDQRKAVRLYPNIFAARDRQTIALAWANSTLDPLWDVVRVLAPTVIGTMAARSDTASYKDTKPDVESVQRSAVNFAEFIMQAGFSLPKKMPIQTLGTRAFIDAFTPQNESLLLGTSARTALLATHVSTPAYENTAQALLTAAAPQMLQSAIAQTTQMIAPQAQQTIPAPTPVMLHPQRTIVGPSAPLTAEPEEIRPKSDMAVAAPNIKVDVEAETRERIFQSAKNVICLEYYSDTELRSFFSSNKKPSMGTKMTKPSKVEAREKYRTDCEDAGIQP